MHDLSRFFAAPPFSWGRTEKAKQLLAVLSVLQEHHEQSCPEYWRLSRMLGSGDRPATVEEIPFLPVRLFKMHDLRSIDADQVSKTLTSSGTTGQAVSRVLLDKDTIHQQAKALAHIVRDFIGAKRVPMVILDCKAVLQNPKMFSARGAGVVGFAAFGRDHFYAFDEHMKLDREGLLAFASKYGSETVLFFGFTFAIWRYFCQALSESPLPLEFADARIVHGGGWKKLRGDAVSNERFKCRLREICGPRTRVHNFYGMVEQTGSIYMECEQGHLHASNFGQVVIRDPITFEPTSFARQGLIETLSVLPWSYPGHALITEDLGELLGEDDCPCGRLGRHFVVHGRVPKAEPRGCSDAHAYD